MFPSLVPDTRRKGRSAGPLVESSSILPRLQVPVSTRPSSLRLQQKAENDKEFEDAIKSEAMALAINRYCYGK